MNREIKFRAWDIKEKEMVFITNLDFMKNSFDESFANNSKGYSKDGYSKYINRNEIILMQFTGLYDKNGVPIYEGDILNSSYGNNKNKGKVFWLKNKGFCYGEESWHSEMHYWSTVYDSLEIIGNIYENPELLK